MQQGTQQSVNQKAQQALPFGEAEASYRERENDLFRALALVRADCWLSRFVERVFQFTQGGHAIAAVVRSYRQMAEDPRWLCCSIAKARSTVRRAVDLGLVRSEEDRLATDGGQAANGYRIDWAGIATILGRGPCPPLAPVLSAHPHALTAHPPVLSAHPHASPEHGRSQDIVQDDGDAPRACVRDLPSFLPSSSSRTRKEGTEEAREPDQETWGRVHREFCWPAFVALFGELGPEGKRVVYRAPGRHERRELMRLGYVALAHEDLDWLLDGVEITRRTAKGDKLQHLKGTLANTSSLGREGFFGVFDLARPPAQYLRRPDADPAEKARSP